MAFPTVKIILEALDKASPEFEKVGKSGTGLKDKMLAVGAAFAALGVTVAAGQAFRKAIDEAREAEESVERLRSALGNAGVAYSDVGEQVEKTLGAIQRSTRFSDDEARDALTTLVTLTGNYEGSLQSLTLVTDLAVAKGVDLNTAATAIGKTMNGSTKELKQFGIEADTTKEAMALLSERVQGFAERDGKTFGASLIQIKNAWNEIFEAVGKAIIGNENVTGSLGKVTDALASVAEWIDKNSDSINSFVGTSVDILSAAFTTLGVIFTSWLGQWNLGLGIAQEAWGLFLSSLGSGVEWASDLLARVGIKIAEGVGDNLKEIGKNVQESGRKNLELGRQQLAEAGKDAAAALTRIFTGKEEHDKKMLDEEKRYQEEMNRAREAARLRAEQQEKDLQASGEEVRKKEREFIDKHHASIEKAYRTLGDKITEIVGRTIPPVIATTTQSIEDLRRAGERALNPSQALEWNAALAGAQQVLDPMTGKMMSLAEYAKLVADRTGEASDHIQLMDKVKDVADAALGAASSFGIISKEAENALSNVIQIADKLPAVLTGDPTAILSVAGSLGSVLTTVFGDSQKDQERRRALRENTEALEELARSNKGLLELQSGGAKAKGVQEALEEAFATRKSRSTEDTIRALGGALTSRGLSDADVTELMKTFGIDGKAGVGAWAQLLEALKTVTSGPVFGTGFGGEMERIRRQFAATGEEDPSTKFAAISGALQQFGGAGIAGLFQGDVLKNLQGVLGKSSAEILSLSGELSPTEFLDTIQDLIELLRDGGEDFGGGVAAPNIPSTPAPTLNPDVVDDSLPSAELPTAGAAIVASAAGATAAGVIFSDGAIQILVNGLDPNNARQVGAELGDSFIEAIDKKLSERQRIESVFSGSTVLT